MPSPYAESIKSESLVGEGGRDRAQALAFFKVSQDSNRQLRLRSSTLISGSQQSPGGLLKQEWMGPNVKSFQFRSSGLGLRICISNYFPCAAAAAAGGTYFEKHHFRTNQPTLET